MDNSDTAVYADLSVLTGWKNEMDSMNESAMQILDSIKQTITDLENYWIGNSSKGFVDASNKMLDDGKKCHTNMNQVSSFLVQVVNAMENQ